jgi:hypothetical protein
MESMRTRAKEHLPSVLLTLLSIIQALALELLWARLEDSAWLWVYGWDAVLGWTQVAAVFLGILLVWLVYTSIVMRFVWAPALRDSVAPFVVGILQFLMIGLLGPHWLGPWFYTLALIFAVMHWANHSTFVRARQDPENAEFFAQMSPATLRDFVPQAAQIAGLVGMGVLLQLSGHSGWLALAAVGFVIAAFLYQMENTRRFWNLTMQPPAPLGEEG